MALTADQLARVKEHAKNAPMPGTTARELVAGQPLHVDGDYAAYYCSGSADTSPGQARANLLERLERAKVVSGSDRVIIHLSASNCTKGLRFLVSDSGISGSKPYQAQRSGSGKPKNWEYLREYMETYEGDKFVPKIWYDREADDAMAYVCEAAYKMGRPSALLTADKDMRMFAGLHIVWKTFSMVEIPQGTYDKVAYDKQYGHKWFWMQMIQGDTADNIPGIPRCGEKAAVDLLRGTQNNAEAFDIVLNLYKQKVGDFYADYFVEQAILLWMRTDKGGKMDDFLTIPGVEFGTDIRRASKRIIDTAQQTHARNMAAHG